MDEITLANRDAPIPVIGLHVGHASDSDSESGRLPSIHARTATAGGQPHDTLAASDAESVAESVASSTTTTPHKRSQSLQDRLFAKCVRMLPPWG